MHVPISAPSVRIPKIFEALPGFFFAHCVKKKPGRASKILGNLKARADIGTCKISARSDKRFPQKGPVTTQLELLRLNWIDCTLKIEMKRNEAENEIKTAERDTRMLSQRKDDLESEIRNLDDQKAKVRETLEQLQQELDSVQGEMDNLTNLRSDLDPLQKNYETRKLELSNLEESLQTKTAELAIVQQQIETSEKVLKYQLSLTFHPILIL